MRIAATYDNGKIFSHFGRTEQFKLYNVENGKVVSSSVVGSNGAGHESLVDLLKGLGVDALICGGIGAGARQVMAAAGIKLYAGVEGDTDAAVEKLLTGNLVYNTEATCDHKHDDHHDGHCGGHTCSHR